MGGGPRRRHRQGEGVEMSDVAEMPKVRGKLTRDAPLAPLVWFKSGGNAEWLFEPADADDLADFLRALDPEVPLMALGLGSNLIVRDGGVPGVVVRLGKAFAKIEQLDDTLLRCGGGASGILVSSTARDAGIAGLEFLRGIPGTVGGFVRMNGGAYGREVQDILVTATLVSRSGDLEDWPLEKLGYRYRHSEVPDGAVVVATNRNVGATREQGEPRHASTPTLGASLWYAWTAPADGWVYLSARGEYFTPVVAVYQGTSLKKLKRVPTTSSDPSYYTAFAGFEAVEGRVYQIALDGLAEEALVGNIELNLQFSTLRMTSPLPDTAHPSALPLPLAIGAPKQERFMAEFSARLQPTVMIGVGAAFDFHSGRVKQAPLWMQRNGLEWLYRLYSQPRRLGRRYLVNVPLFLVRIALQLSGLRKYPLD
jgi:hypothetical protein